MYARYTVTLRSGLRTPLQSDTIFGHLCWGIRYLEGDGQQALEAFLDRYDSGDPPMLISCAVPKGFLPRPVLPSMGRNLLHFKAAAIGRDMGFEGKKAVYNGLTLLKSLRKRAWVRVEDWLAIRDVLSESALVERLLDRQGKDNEIPGEGKTTIRDHNSISRTTNRVLDPGGLYAVEEHWRNPEDQLQIYVWFSGVDEQAFWDRLWQEYIVPTGFGKDKSTGAGWLDIVQDTAFDSDLFALDGADAHMSLSNAALPDWPGGIFGFYKTFCKHGKLGGHFAVHGPAGGPANPFKKPLLMLRPGAVFKGEPPKGRLLANVHVDASIQHYGLPLCLPARLEVQDA